MKKFLYFFLIFLVSCSYTTAVASADPDWGDVEKRVAELDAAGDSAGVVEYTDTLSDLKWAKWQLTHLSFWKGRALFKMNNYKESLTVFETIKETAPFTVEIHLMAGEAAFNEKQYNDALKWILHVYTTLEPAEKIKASKTVFLSFLYSKRIDKAAFWYSKLDEVKQKNIEDALEKWLKLSPSNEKDFNNALNNLEEVSEELMNPGKNDANAVAPDEDQINPTAETEETSGAEGEEAAGEVSAEAVVPTFDPGYKPDWNNLCVLLSMEEKWSKFNEVITSFIGWYFKDYRKMKLNIMPISYSERSEIDGALKQAKEKKCFAAMGPFFAPDFAEEIVQKSAEYSVPVVAYIPTIDTSNNPLLFNVMPSRELEAENLLKYATGEREKKNFAIAYINDFNGRKLRDIYWRKIEENGGQVTDLIDISPSDNAFFDDVEEVVGKQDNYAEVLRVFKYRNKEKFTTDAMMKRALDRFEKSIPGKCDFDTLVVLTPPAQTAMLLPSFPYVNVEFAYFQKYLNRAVSQKKQDLRKDGYDWDIQQILVLSLSEISSNKKSIEQLDKLVDGMVVYAPLNDTSENNPKLRELNSKFFENGKRQPYFIEQLVAETADLLYSALNKSAKNDIGEFVEVIKSTEYTSLLSAVPVKFDDKNRLAGRSAIMIGRKKEPFMTPAQIEEEMKRKEEEKREKEKSGQNPQQNQQESAYEATQD